MCGCGKFLVGLGSGIVLGAALGMTLSPSRREMKRIAHQAAKHVSEAVSAFTDAMDM